MRYPALKALRGIETNAVPGVGVNTGDFYIAF
jgi:hypothetical protein